MDTKTVTFILTAVAALIFAGLLVSIPFRTKKIKSESGALLLKLKGDFPIRSVVIFAVCAALIFVVPFRNFELYLSAVFLAVALIATYISVKEAANSTVNGVYEKMIVSETSAVKYDDIISLPTISYEDDPETTGVDKKLLEVIVKSGAKITFVFPDENIRKEALEIILKCKPSLKQ